MPLFAYACQGPLRRGCPLSGSSGSGSSRVPSVRGSGAVSSTVIARGDESSTSYDSCSTSNPYSRKRAAT